MKPLPSCPTIDLARSEILTTTQLCDALEELQSASAGKVVLTLRIDRGLVARIGSAERIGPTAIEDVLIAVHDALVFVAKRKTEAA